MPICVTRTGSQSGGFYESKAQTMESKRVSQKERIRRGGAFDRAFRRSENRAGASFVS